MKYEKLSKRALGCMYVAAWIVNLIVGAIILGVNLLLFIPEDIRTAQIISLIIAGLLVLIGLLSPWFRFHRYRYSINDECIDIMEGYIFVERNIVPIERLHKLQTIKGPIDQIFGVAKVVVTTAGGDVTIRFLDEKKAEDIADTLRKRINEVAIQEKKEAMKVTAGKNEGGVADGEE